MYSTLTTFLRQPVALGSQKFDLWKVSLATVGSVLVAYKIVKRLNLPKFNKYTTGEQVLDGIDLTNKICIVTGANTGLGKETTRVLVKHGCTVIMACRTISKAEKAKEDIIKSLNDESLSDNINIMELDLSKLQSVKIFAQKFVNTFDRLDYLINNAGVMALPEYGETKDGFEMQWGVNHIGHAYLTTLLTPILKKSAPSRVICLTSSGHRLSPKPLSDYLNTLISEKRGPNKENYQQWTNYGISKTSNILFAREYNKRNYIKNGISAFAVHPGAIWTDLARHLSWYITAMYIVMVYSGWMPSKNIPQGVSTTLRCVQLSEEDIKNCNGHYFVDCQDHEKITLRNDHRRTQEMDKLSKQFYDLTIKLIEDKKFSLNI